MERRVEALIPPLLVVALAAIAAALSGCAECQSFTDCEGDGFMACVDGQCAEVASDEGPTCEAAADCGDAAAWACSDGHCAPRPPCQRLDDKFTYEASCATRGTITGEATAVTTDCQVQITSAQPIQMVLALSTLETTGDLVDDAVDTGGTCFPGVWSAVDSVLYLPLCDVDGDTCDIAFTGKALPRAACVLASTAPCEGGGTCGSLVDVPGAGVCE